MINNFVGFITYMKVNVCNNRCGEVKNTSIMLRNFYMIEKNGLVLLETDFSKLKIHSTNPEVNIQ